MTLDALLPIAPAGGPSTVKSTPKEVSSISAEFEAHLTPIPPAQSPLEDALPALPLEAEELLLEENTTLLADLELDDKLEVEVALPTLLPQLIPHPTAAIMGAVVEASIPSVAEPDLSIDLPIEAVALQESGSVTQPQAIKPVQRATSAAIEATTLLASSPTPSHVAPDAGEVTPAISKVTLTPTTSAAVASNVDMPAETISEGAFDANFEAKIDIAQELPKTNPSRDAPLPTIAEPRRETPNLPPLVRNVMDRLENMQFEEGKTRLLLRPQGLGLLEIDLARMVDGRLQLIVRAENPLILDALRQEGSALGLFMQERGFDLSGGQPEFSAYEAAATDEETQEDELPLPPEAQPEQILGQSQLNILT